MKNYHFIGIGGIGMGTLASLLLDQGCIVTGSDLKGNLMTAQLIEKGARVVIGHHAENVDTPDCVVYSSAVKSDNPEIKIAKSKKIPILKRAEVLASLMAEKKGIAVAGAHGKTTASSMIAHILKTAGLHPSIAIGGVVNNGLYSANTGGGEYFVAEVDESDGSFLCFAPQYSVLTNIDFEHIDFYQNWENILKAYRQYFMNTKEGGCIVAFGDDENIQYLLKESGKRYTTYGFRDDNVFKASSVTHDGFCSTFECIFKEEVLGKISLNIPGKHNILNALAAVALAIELDIDFKIIQESFLSYQGVQRRFTPRLQNKDVLLIEDYGHHPTEIAATLEAAKAFDGFRRVVVFQPHRYTRTKFLMQEFSDSFEDCEYFILTDIYAASEKEQKDVCAMEIIDRLKQKKPVPCVFLKMENIVDHVLKIVQPKDLILVLGAGDIHQIIGPLAEKLKKRFS
ncbi:MAG: UDP-N-acetylmuramate--L-alanine ligase [Candidatus Aceula meridiana]|nr:UDP-N-acetylmuramate--L-alanine ligase [Candidatus Aceula meridiana]